LPDAAGDGHDLGLGAVARGAPQSPQALERVGDFEDGPLGLGDAALFDECGGGAGLERGRNILMAVLAHAGNGAEEIVPGQRARIDRDAARGERRAGAAAGGGGCVGIGPENGACVHGWPSTEAAALRATSMSSNGSTLSPTIWPCSWPLPAMTSASPGARAAIAAVIASARSPISIAPGAAARISRRIAAGSSERRLSSVPSP